MSNWIQTAREALLQGVAVEVRPIGRSMRGRIESGELVRIAPCAADAVQEGDVVFVKWKRSYLLHLVVKLARGQALIGNNVGGLNGWVGLDQILGKVVEPPTAA